MRALEGRLKQICGRPAGRCYPINYPNGARIGNVSAVTIGSIGTNRNTLTVSRLPSGYVMTVGDYIQYGSNLHQVVYKIGTEIEVRPHLRPTIALGNAVTLVLPSGRMTIVPGTISTTSELATGRGTISFQGYESR